MKKPAKFTIYVVAATFCELLIIGLALYLYGTLCIMLILLYGAIHADIENAYSKKFLKLCISIAKAEAKMEKLNDKIL